MGISPQPFQTSVKLLAWPDVARNPILQICLFSFLVVISEGVKREYIGYDKTVFPALGRPWEEDH